MRYRHLLMLPLVATLVAAPLAAQHSGTVELGAFGRYTKFGDPLATDVINHLPAKNGFGFGGRLGIFFLRNLEVEADLSRVKVNAAGTVGQKVTSTPIHAGLTYNVPLGEHSAFLLGGRYVRNSYKQTTSFHDNGYGALAGLRLGPIRLDATMDWMGASLPGHAKYHNLGADAGLSLLLGKQCDKSADGVSVTPGSTRMDRGATAMFSAAATICGKPRAVTWTATGGTISSTGTYAAGSVPGTYMVTATELKSGMTGTASVVINEPPPPPPVVTMTRINLTPDNAEAKVNEMVSFSVVGTMSDGTQRPMGMCPLTASGNPQQSGNSFSWTRYGAYTVTAHCEGLTDQSSVEVPLEVVIFGTNFAFNKDALSAVGRDKVRAAADSLKLYPEIKVRLGGFADAVGSDEYNCDLSWRRARSVQSALSAFGIASDRITMVEGFGEGYPLADAKITDDMRQINTSTHDKGMWWDRRVSITSASKPAGMMACSESEKSMKRRP